MRSIVVMNAWASRISGRVQRSVHFHYRRGERQAPALGPSQGTYRAPPAGRRMGCRTRTVAASRGRIGVRDHACYSVRVPRRERLDTVRSYSSAEERSVHTGEVTGSNPVRTTTQDTEPLPVSPGGVRRFPRTRFRPPLPPGQASAPASACSSARENTSTGWAPLTASRPSRTKNGTPRTPISRAVSMSFRT